MRKLKLLLFLSLLPFSISSFNQDQTIFFDDVKSSNYVVDERSLNPVDNSIDISNQQSSKPTITFITGDNVYQAMTMSLSKASKMTKEEFLSYFKATDYLGNDISSNIYLEEDFNIKKDGQYTFTLSCVDSSLNKSIIKVNLNVYINLPPCVIINSKTFILPTDYHLSTSQIRNALINFFYANKKDSIKSTIVGDETYQKNSSKVGSYDVFCKVNFEDDTSDEKTFHFKVINSKFESKKTFWDQLSDFFSNFFEKVVNLFSGEGWYTNNELGKDKGDFSL